MNRTSVGFQTSFHPISYWITSGLREKGISVPYMGSMMFYMHAQMVMFSEHAQDVLLFCGHVYWFEGLIMPTDGCSVWMPIIFVKSKFYEDRFFAHQKIYLHKVQQPHTQQECG